MGRVEGEKVDREKVLEELIKGLGDIAKEIRNKTETERFLRFFSWLNSELQTRGLGRIIITGGFAAEIYSARAYRTGDVDIIIEGAGEIVRALLRSVSDVGLRIYLLRFPQLSQKGIDIVGEDYDKEKPPIRVEINGRWVYMVPPEEVVVSCLSAWKFWNSLEDRDKAFLVLAVQAENIDMEYLRKRAKEEDVLDRLEGLKALL